MTSLVHAHVCFAHVFYFVLLQAVRFLSQTMQNSMGIWQDYVRQMLKRHETSTDSQQNVRHIAEAAGISLTMTAILGAWQYNHQYAAPPSAPSRIENPMHGTTILVRSQLLFEIDCNSC